MGAINWSWRREKNISLYGPKAYETDSDFSSEKFAKQSVDKYFSDQRCDACGSRDLSGSNILVSIQRIELFAETKKRTLFGGENLIEKHWKTVFRVGDIMFPAAHIFSSGGHIKCKKCKHRTGSLSFLGQWAKNVSDGHR